MADPIITKNIHINAEPVSPVRNPQTVNAPKPEETKVNDNRPEANPYENVVSVSDDGDTVQVKPEANERLSDGFVFNKSENKEDRTEDEKDAQELVNGPVNEEKKDAQVIAKESASEISEEKEERLHEMIKDAVEKADETKEAVKESNQKFNDNEEADKKAAEKNAAVSSNYGTVSDSELERMYLTGQITSFDYNREIKSREEEDEQRENAGNEVAGAVNSADAALKENENLQRNVVNGNAGEGYQTREEQDAVREVLYGAGKEKDDPKNFEINIIK